MEFKPKARVSDLVIQESGSELLIYDLKTNRAQSLNETSTRIWRSCSGKREAADICNYLEESDGVHVNEDLVLLAIRQLSDSDLLDANMPESDKPGRVSRRKLLRQIGAGSAVALPIIHSIVAPQASAAATAACTNSVQRGVLSGEPIPNTQGTCPVDFRCSGPAGSEMCIPCIPIGGLIPGGVCNSPTAIVL